MDWTVRGSNPEGGEIFRTCTDRPWVLPSHLHNGYRVFPGGKERPGHDADPSPSSSAFGHERVELYLFSPYGPYGLTEPQCLYKGAFYLFFRASFFLHDTYCFVFQKGPSRGGIHWKCLCVLFVDPCIIVQFIKKTPTRCNKI